MTDNSTPAEGMKGEADAREGGVERLATMPVEHEETARLTLCGSTKFRAEYELWNKRLTLAGFLVYSVSGFGHSGDSFTAEEKHRLDQIHLAKIDASHAIVVINPGGYIGESTAREIEHAKGSGKPVYYTDQGAPTVYQLRTGPNGTNSLRYRAFDYAHPPAAFPARESEAVADEIEELVQRWDKLDGGSPAAQGCANRLACLVANKRGVVLSALRALASPAAASVANVEALRQVISELLAVLPRTGKNIEIRNRAIAALTPSPEQMDGDKALMRDAAVGEVEITQNQRNSVVADYGEHFLVAHVSKDGKMVGIDHPCDAVWADVLTAHVALRDRINERIAEQDGCPFKPTPTPVEERAKGAVEVLRRIVNTESLQKVQPVPRDPQEVAAFLSREIGAIRSLARAALAALRPQAPSDGEKAAIDVLKASRSDD